MNERKDQAKELLKRELSKREFWFLKFGWKLGIVGRTGKFYFDRFGEYVEILIPNQLGGI
jgi:hypothetical protein